MLTFLQGKVSERKMRLFLVACARLVWKQMVDATMRQAVEVAEHYAEEQVSYEELQASHDKIYYFASSDGPGSRERAKTMGIPFGIYHSLFGLSLACGFTKQGLDNIVTTWSWREGIRLTGPHQPFRLREIFGNPFAPVTLDRAWLVPEIVTFVQAIYDERAFDRMPILADAAEEAGCTNQDILAHCRSGGDHVRGCWVVDLLLGKK
jgi:hypothetical protein